MSNPIVTMHEATIGGVTYKAKTLPASKGLVILPKLIVLFGEPILKLVLSTTNKEQEHMLEDPKILAALLTNVATKASEDSGLLVLRDLMQGVTCDQLRLSEEAIIVGDVYSHFDTHFAGRYMHLVEVAMWVAKLNFTGP